MAPDPARTAGRTSRGCRAGRAILSRYTVGRMVAKPRVAANTASVSAEAGTNTAKVRMKSASWAVSASPWRENTSASSGAYHQAASPSRQPAAATGQRPTARARRRSRVRPRAR